MQYNTIVRGFLALIVVAVVMTTCKAISAECDHKLIQALIQVESAGNDRAIGDRHLKDKAYGPLQIRKPCLEDVNRRHKTKYRPEDMLGNRSLSVWVCQKYIEMYATKQRLGRNPTLEDMARIWNGGPSGWRKESTQTYWSKVRKALQQGQLASK